MLPGSRPLSSPSCLQVLTGGGGSGEVRPSRVVSPLDGLRQAFGRAGTVTYYDGTDKVRAAQIAHQSDACVAVLATTSGEGGDRDSLSLPADDIALAKAAVAAQPRCVAVAVAPGAILTDWAEDFGALLVMFMPGQEEGNALADVLFGAMGPSGRLPLTFPKVENEVQFTKAQWPGVEKVANYSEGLLVGYRWYHAHRVCPCPDVWPGPLVRLQNFPVFPLRNRDYGRRRVGR